MTPPDDDLKRVFDKLRTAETLAAPSFAGLVAPEALHVARRRRRSRQLRVSAAAAGGSLLLLLIALGPDPRAPIEQSRALSGGIDLGSVYWRAPSDFLLDTPGRELLRTLPTLTTIDAAVRSPVRSLPAESTTAPDRRPRS